MIACNRSDLNHGFACEASDIYENAKQVNSSRVVRYARS